MINNLDDYRWLLSAAAEPWLATISDDPVRLLSRLRKDLSPERAHLVVEQIDLRQRAREKFKLADKMFFTRKGLEQATDEHVAAYKALRFAPNEGVADLCCGIGGDLLALATGRPLWGYDTDPVMVLLARANLDLVEPGDHHVLQVNAQDVAIEGGAWHCDPDRRAAGRRSIRVELFSPSLESLNLLLAESSDAAIKLAPATEAPSHWHQAAELEWLESRGECRQQVAWFGHLARHPGSRSATILRSDDQQRTLVGNSDQSPPIASNLGRYLYEPSAAILAAKLTTELCREHNLAAISPGVAYLTGENPINDIALDAFEIIDVLPYDRKQLRAYCREHNLGRLEIKKRGVEVDPERLRKEIVADGDNAATILIAPHQQQVRAIIAHRITPEK